MKIIGEVHSVGGTVVTNNHVLQHAYSEGVSHWFWSRFGGIKDNLLFRNHDSFY